MKSRLEMAVLRLVIARRNATDAKAAHRETRKRLGKCAGVGCWDEGEHGAIPCKLCWEDDRLTIPEDLCDSCRVCIPLYRAWLSASHRAGRALAVVLRLGRGLEG